MRTVLFVLRFPSPQTPLAVTTVSAPFYIAFPTVADFYGDLAAKSCNKRIVRRSDYGIKRRKTRKLPKNCNNAIKTAQTNRVKKFFGSAAFLAAAGLLAKLLGAFHKVPLIGVLGAEGTGLYQLVFPMYTVLLTLAGGGIPQAVSRAVARENAVDGDVRGVLKAALLSMTAIGMLGSALLALGGGAVARLQGNPMAALSYMALSPAVLFSGLIAAMRGYWQGKRNMFPTAASQLSEQAVKLVAGLSLASHFMCYGVHYGVMGAILGITLGEAVTALALGASLLFVRDKASGGRGKLMPLVAAISKDALPIGLGSLVLPLLQLIDSVTIVNLLVFRGADVATATSLFGIATAPVGAIANLPPVFTSAVASALMPVLAAEFGKGGTAEKQISEAFVTCWFVGICGAVTIFVFAREILDVLYFGGLTVAQTSVAVTVMRINGVGVLYVCCMQTVCTVLQARGKAYRPALNLLVAGVLKAALTVVLTLLLGVCGSAIATVAAYALAFALDVRAARSYMSRIPLRPMVCCTLAAVAGGMAGAAARLLPMAGRISVCLVGGGVFGLAALAVLLATNTFGIVWRIENLFAALRNALRHRRSSDR